MIPARWASAVRKTPARNEQVRTAITPPKNDVGVSQDDHRSPRPCAGTRPEAIAPATAPRKNGVTTEEAAKTTPKNRARPRVSEYLRNAKLEPRSTIPSSAKSIGRISVDIAEANDSGNAGPPDHEHVDQPHVVGLPDRADAVVDQGPQLRALHVAARGQVVGAGAEVGPAQHAVHDHAQEECGGDDEGQAHGRSTSRWVSRSRSCGPYGLGRSRLPLRQRRVIERMTTVAATVIAA